MKITFKPDSILVLSYSRQILEGKKDFNKIRAPKNSNLKEMIAYNLGIVYPEPIEEITEETAEVVAPTEEKEDADQTEEPVENEKEVEEVVETPIKQTKPMPKPKHIG